MRGRSKTSWNMADQVRMGFWDGEMPAQALGVWENTRAVARAAAQDRRTPNSRGDGAFAKRYGEDGR